MAKQLPFHIPSRNCFYSQGIITFPLTSLVIIISAYLGSMCFVLHVIFFFYVSCSNSTITVQLKLSPTEGEFVVNSKFEWKFEYIT